MLNFTNNDFLDDINFGLPESFQLDNEMSGLYNDIPNLSNQTELIFKLAPVEENEKFVLQKGNNHSWICLQGRNSNCS